MKKVTVVIPAYNMEAHISLAIESVIKQSYSHWELIIINDGSTDNTEKVINTYLTDSRIKLINQPNMGVSVARNSGIAEATGDAITFLDADDYYDPRYLELMAKPIFDGVADMTFCKFQEIDSDKNIITQTPENVVKILNNSFTDHIEYIPYAKANMAIMYRLSKIQDNNLQFFPKSSFAEDTEFVLKAAFSFRIQFIPEYLYFYVFRENSASRGRFNSKKYLQEIAAYSRALEYISANQEKGLDSQVFLSYMNKLLFTTKNRARRYLWNTIGNRNFNDAIYFLETYENRYQQKFDVPFTGLKKISNWFKLAIIRSKNRTLWRIIVPKSTKKYE